MAWKAMDIQEQRVRFVVAASRGEKSHDGNYARSSAISRPTGALWVKTLMPSPALPGSPRQQPSSAQLAFADHLGAGGAGDRAAAALCGLGRAQTGSTAERGGREAGAQHDPSHSAERYDLVEPRDRRQLAAKRFEREHPNQLWQMDFKGPKNWAQAVGPLSVLDDHSRYAITLAATGKLDGDLVRAQLEKAFERCGVPDAMLMDHGTPWWNWQSFSGRTQLSLWMMRQGIRLLFSGVAHPQTQGKVERFHGSLQRALDRRGLQHEPQAWLDNYRAEYNQLRPHEALGMKTPASMWRPSSRRYNPNPSPWQYPENAWTLKVDCQGTIDLKGIRWRIGKTLAGERVMIQPLEQRWLIFYCSTLVREIDPQAQRSTIRRALERSVKHL